MTLVVMAAGMGSRYGGLKQLDPIGKNGEFIIDFSIYDAIKAGFEKVVFVIKKENYELFRDTVGKRIEGQITVEYAFQSVDSLPKGFAVPDGRIKPWGTAHAVLSAKEHIDGQFAAINADDFYGAESFALIANHLKQSDEKMRYCMAGFVLKNTLTENGSVARGICNIDDSGFLTDITERTKIIKTDDGAAWTDDGDIHPVSGETVVSMNCWGFSHDFADSLQSGFRAFLNANRADLSKCEYYLPSAVREQMDNGATVKVLKTNAKWFGVTYREDRSIVVDAIKALQREGAYPEALWN